MDKKLLEEGIDEVPYMTLMKSKLARTLIAMLTLVLAVQFIGWFAFGKEQAIIAVFINTCVASVVTGIFCYYLFRLNQASCLVCLMVIFGIHMSLMQGTTPRRRVSLFYYALDVLAGKKTGVFETGMAMDVLLVFMGIITIITAMVTAKVSKSMKRMHSTGAISFLKDVWSSFTKWEEATLANKRKPSEDIVKPVNDNEADGKQI